jgi:hypothetical protein
MRRASLVFDFVTGAWSHLCALTLLLAATAASAQTTSPAPPLTIGFAGREVVASGATVGGKVAWFSVAKEIRNSAAQLQRRDAIVDAGATGEATFALDEPVAPLSIWVAVDVASGRFAVAPAPTFERRELLLAPDAFQPGARGSDDVLRDTHEFLEVALVRPSKGDRGFAGAWAGTVGDGGRSDGDARSNGEVVLPLSRLRPIGQSAELLPPVWAPGDVVAVIDPNAMAVQVTTVSPGARP